eukprot:TRINITY_DN11108_c0_g1_i1.p1 TRINITY_DN11108_c0_g1~~TRINITY_DN11108_c0_g1_i1.p1  ORF type:complete len:101 (+),score=0.91 TRINITY_DN11108_c0_g1_i1:68-370(+)
MIILMEASTSAVQGRLRNLKRSRLNAPATNGESHSSAMMSSNSWLGFMRTYPPQVALHVVQLPYAPSQSTGHGSAIECRCHKTWSTCQKSSKSQRSQSAG